MNKSAFFGVALLLASSQHSFSYPGRLQSCDAKACATPGTFCYALPKTEELRWTMDGPVMHLTFRLMSKNVNPTTGFTKWVPDPILTDMDVTIPATGTVLLCGGSRPADQGEVAR